MSIIRHLARAVLRPAATARPSLFRDILAQPVVFDVVSALAQWRDSARVEKAAGKYIDEDIQVKKTVDHNVKMARRFTQTRRVDPFYRVLTAGAGDVSSKKLLIIGGRTIQEFLLAWTHGFRWNNMTGIDLISINPKILPMNMEAMTFPDESFDFITSISTFGYTNGLEKGLRECARVLKPDGRLVFDHDYRPGQSEYPAMNVRADEVAKVLKDSSLEIYYHTARDKMTSDGFRQTIHVFGCRKIPANEDLIDPYRPY